MPDRFRIDKSLEAVAPRSAASWRVRSSSRASSSWWRATSSVGFGATNEMLPRVEIVAVAIYASSRNVVAIACFEALWVAWATAVTMPIRW